MASAPAQTQSATVPAASSSTNLPAASDAAKKRFVKGEFSTYTTLGVSAYKDKSAAPESDNFIGLKLNVGEAQNVNLRQGFLYNYAFEDQPAKATVKDFMVGYTNANIAKFGKDDAGSVTGIFRVYLPTGESSRFVTKTAGSLYTWWITSYSLGKVDLSAHFIGSWYNQTQDSYLDSKGNAKANNDLYYLPFVNMDWNISDKITFSQSFGSENMIYRPLPGKGVAGLHTYTAMTTMTVQPVSGVTVMFGVSNDINLEKQERAFQVMRDDELTYVLQLTASI
jgi:hypothetical protein